MIIFNFSAPDYNRPDSRQRIIPALHLSKVTIILQKLSENPLFPNHNPRNCQIIWMILPKVVSDVIISAPMSSGLIIVLKR